MSNTKTTRKNIFAIGAITAAVFCFGWIGGGVAQAGATPASNPAKETKKAVSGKETTTSASKKKLANTVKPPKLAKESFSYIPFAQLVLKDGRAYKAGEDQPYTGFVWDTGEDLEFPAGKNPFPGEDTRLFHYFKDGKIQQGDFLTSKFVPKYSSIWETKKRQGVTTVSIYLLRDNVRTAITNDNFFELKDECFYLKYRTRTNEVGDVVRAELFDQDGTRVFSVVNRKDDFSGLFEAVGDDGIFRKFTMNLKTGRPDGPMEAYHPNGKLFYETVYTDGDPGSIVELYDSEGKKAFRLYFETNLLAERSHTSNLTLVEEWDEANQRFVDRDKEHFNMFIKFCRPSDELVPRDYRDDLKLQSELILLEAFKNTEFFDREVKMRDLIEESIQDLSAGR